MAEYIKKEDVLRAYEEVQRRNGPWRFETLIESVPTADVAPVQHGRWVHEHISEGYAWVICSECEAVIHKILINKRLNYCPNCGAKMDGGADR